MKTTTVEAIVTTAKLCPKYASKIAAISPRDAEIGPEVERKTSGNVMDVSTA